MIYPLAFLAGILTILAPCVLPMLPIILGGTLSTVSDWRRPLLINVSLAISIIFFSLILKASTAFIGVSPHFWSIFSGLLLMAFGLVSLFPRTWDSLAVKFRINQGSQTLLMKSQQKRGWLGASLGPVFASCSPTYTLILAIILPQGFFQGLLSLALYALGLGLMMFLVSLLGQKIISRFRFALNPHGWFRRGFALFFLAMGLAITSGFDKKMEIAAIESGYFDPSKLEFSLIHRFYEKEVTKP